MKFKILSSLLFLFIGLNQSWARNKNSNDLVAKVTPLPDRGLDATLRRVKMVKTTSPYICDHGRAYLKEFAYCEPLHFNSRKNRVSVLILKDGSTKSMRTNQIWHLIPVHQIPQVGKTVFMNCDNEGLKCIKRFAKSCVVSGIKGQDVIVSCSKKYYQVPKELLFKAEVYLKRRGQKTASK